MNWLPQRVLPQQKFPEVKYGEKRAVTWDEHTRILAREGNPERRDYYGLCYYLGGSQTDVASLQAEDVDCRSFLCLYRHWRRIGKKQKPAEGAGL